MTKRLPGRGLSVAAFKRQFERDIHFCLTIYGLPGGGVQCGWVGKQVFAGVETERNEEAMKGRTERDEMVDESFTPATELESVNG
jgi:hypothetical protein